MTIVNGFTVKTIINCCSYDCSKYEKNLLNFKQEKTSKESQTTIRRWGGGEGGGRGLRSRDIEGKPMTNRCFVELSAKS